MSAKKGNKKCYGDAKGLIMCCKSDPLLRVNRGKVIGKKWSQIFIRKRHKICEFIQYINNRDASWSIPGAPLLRLTALKARFRFPKEAILFMRFIWSWFWVARDCVNTSLSDAPVLPLPLEGWKMISWRLFINCCYPIPKTCRSKTNKSNSGLP